MQIRILCDDLKEAFYKALIKTVLSEERSKLCGSLLAENQRDGVYSHGLNRFPGVVAELNAGRLHGNAEPEFVKALVWWNNGMARWAWGL